MQHEPSRDEQLRTPLARTLLVRGGLVVAGALVVSGLGGSIGRARATDTASPVGVVEAASQELQDLQGQLEATRGELAVVKLQIERTNAIIEYSRRYAIPADLSAAIYDIALSEGIDPSLGYRLVKVESNFSIKARSNKNAIGYTQIQPATARYYDPDITEAELFDRETNLRFGFRFLRDLMRRYDTLELALLAYNRGPGRVDQIMAEGGDPANGYEEAVLRGYKPRS